ncbi:amino acid permease/ SLC12A domain-containing protein [Hypoxylon cercidicola]|nr:amino acid permease/ SLC12A domain-containing protein [Hypoxylon cercidicola]
MSSDSPTPAADTSLQKVITTRQFIFMALSSSIGAGVLLATYSSLAVGGPGSILVSFTVVGFAVWITMCALGELSAAFPVTGSFYEYSVRFISPAWGFSMGWNYVMNFLLIVAFELVVMILCVQYWLPDMLPEHILPAFIAGLILVNAFGAKWYAEMENFFALCKMLVLTSFVIVAIVILRKVVPSDSRSADELGIHIWERGAFKNGPAGFLYVFMAAGMAYGGTEMLGLMAAECKSPEKVMPLACKIVPIRIVWLYLLPILMVGFVLDVPLEPGVISGGVSPFVAAMDQAGLHIVGTIFNSIIILAIFSMASASVFASSRALQAISARGMGPAIFAKVKWGHPIWALVLVYIFSLLSFIKAAQNGDRIFEWLLALAAGSNYFTWISICVCHIRLRLAIRNQGLNKEDILKWKSPVGVVGSVLAIVVFLFGLAAQIVAAVQSPLPEPPHILSSMLGIIIVVVFWAGYTLVKRDTYWIPLGQINLQPKEEWTARLGGNNDIESAGAEMVESSNEQ